MSLLLFFASASEEVQRDFENTETSVLCKEDDRLQENISASVVIDSDLENGDRIHEYLCLSLFRDSACSFLQRIPHAHDLVIETAFRDEKKAVQAALEKCSPPDGAPHANLTDQDIIDAIAGVLQEHGDCQL